MKHNFSKSNTATGKTAVNYLGASVLNDVEIPIYGYNATSINDILEHMCDMCVNHVKNGRPVYTFITDLTLQTIILELVYHSTVLMVIHLLAYISIVI